MAGGIFDLPVHPAANIFPMLSDDELNELADDIKTHGLLHPLIIKDGQLVDGRNRREACRRVGIKPRVEELNGADPVAFVLSANITRRHLSKSQRAMAVAMLYPEPEKGGRGKKASKNEGFTGVAAGYVSQARTVLTWLPVIAAAVLAGTTPLNKAYEEALAQKQAQDSDAVHLSRLRERDPKLAAAVDDGTMSLLEAESTYERRQEDLRRQRRAVLEVLDSWDRAMDHLIAGNQRAGFLNILLDQPEDRQRAIRILTQWATNIAETLEALHGDHREEAEQTLS